MKLKITALLFSFIFISYNISAQQMLGISNSNYSGTDALYLNPSFVSGSPYKLFIKLFSMQMGMNNNYVKFTGSIYGSNLVFDETTLQQNKNGKPKMANIYTDIRLPSFMFKVNSKIDVGLITRNRFLVQGSNISEIIAEQLVNNSNADKYLNTLNQNTNLNLNVNLFSEIGVVYGHKILETEQHIIRGGITLKHLVGVYSAHLNSQDLTFTLNKEFSKTSEQTVANIQHINVNYGYTNWVGNRGSLSDWLTSSGMPGKGWGADLGLSYENRKSSDDDYTFKLGLALVDIGSIKYKSDQDVFNYSIERSNKKLTLDDVNKAYNSSADSIVQTFNQVLNVQPNEKSNSFKSGLPTSLNLTFDYKIVKKIYVNATLIQNMRSKTAISTRQNSLFSVTPRVQMKGFEFSLPLILMNNYKNFALGTALRFGPLYVGSDNVAGLLGISKPYGLDFYFGMRFGFFNKKKVDAAE